MGGFFVILKFVMSLLDDIALVFKKTSSILADDLAVGAAKSSNFGAEKESALIYKIGKGAILNKIILLPIILGLDYFFPKVIIWALIAGGAFLAYEAAEKTLHYFLHKKEENEIKDDTDEEKVKSAVLIDFILSIEIIIIAMAAVQNTEYSLKVITVSIVSFGVVFAVYGLIWLLVKMDDLGFWLKEKYEHPKLMSLANGLISGLPIIIKCLAVLGTLAMFLVCGGIYIHNIDFFHHLNESYNYGLFSEIILGAIIGFSSLLLMEILKNLFIPIVFIFAFLVEILG